MKDFSIKWRIIKNNIFKISIIGISLISIIPLFLILFFIFQKGIASINLNFFIAGTKPTGEIGGGIANALIGTVILVLIAFAIAVPFGVITGIYLSDNKKSKLASWVRWAVELIQGVPSIVLGLIGYAWLVLPLSKLTGGKISFSALAGGLTLSIMMLPSIIKSTEETLKLIPHSLKESALALGVPYYKTMLFVILPAGLSGIITGILLGVARIAGETAPLLFTAFGNYYMNVNILKPIDSMPLLIFNYATSPYEDLHNIAWGASFVLVSFVLLLNIFARLVVKRWKVQF
ncbi:MAG: phosphate ABC transporter, permease protein PstA [Spirochaetes bacterium GWD1_27_9]|nr:MAG: phosphate ABC transporter, permease protein PstA [Spirochaetes bacterium GWB1_27_13]OHD21491.1 MAG: phosphate ABC transporter, permease protein PstA [Spirochaetes bacterium GWC1_27_15]OHD44845.1 MAG: phosphate ABC transporter, permease protein PstA [Spirochaetes bacterium GWD1_27_9]